ncbi:hypothetical protein, partial [Providencia sp. PROV032]|uniref:hypothetical protein n=1 Tax=Providencia sp. PROV032 TaxID=2949764 RepID=UPI00234AAC7B
MIRRPSIDLDETRYFHSSRTKVCFYFGYQTSLFWLSDVSIWVIKRAKAQILISLKGEAVCSKLELI